MAIPCDSRARHVVRVRPVAQRIPRDAESVDHEAAPDRVAPAVADRRAPGSDLDMRKLSSMFQSLRNKHENQQIGHGGSLAAT